MGKNSYTDEFKKQIVMLYQNGKSIIEIINEYGISKAAIYNWIKSFDNSGSFKAKDNRSNEKKWINLLTKRIKTITNGKRYFKASRTDNGQKITIINNNKKRYSVKKYVRFWVYQNQRIIIKLINALTSKLIIMNKKVIGAFNTSHKIKAILIRKDMILSRQKIRCIMIKNNLVSKYTKLKYRNHKTTVTNDQISNVLNHQFNNEKPNEIIVSGF